MRSITGCISYLVNMTRPDLAFAYSQLSKFVQRPGPVHLAAAERVLAYLRGTYDQVITFCDPGKARQMRRTQERGRCYDEESTQACIHLT